jgi:tetratricopeptide (TPR) repeat protein
MLGRGGMGKVYRAYDRQLNEDVAIKIIKPEIASDKKTLSRFSNELKITRKIVHRNVGRMYELMQDEGKYFITMEYVPGQDLKGLIRQSEKLAVDTAIKITKQLCEGLAEAHKLGVVHRDLKPSNIMVDINGNARIMDFGIARSLKTKGMTRAGLVVGTPEYMSPEQVDGFEADQRSDIYSLGVIIFDMLTGRIPFEGDSTMSIALKHKTDSPPDPMTLNPQIPENFNRLILKCLEKEREERYQNVEEILGDLEKIEKGLPIVEKKETKRKPLTAREITVTIGMKRLVIPVVAVVVIATIAIVIWQALSKNQIISIPEGKPSLAVMYFENNTGDEKLDHYRKALSDLLITDLAQSKHLMVLSGARLYNILKDQNLLDEKSYSSNDLKGVAEQSGVEHIVLGSYTKAGDNFRINVALHRAKTEELIGSERVEGIGEQSIFSMVDELTRKIKTHFKLTEKQIVSDTDRNVGMITTSSPEALKFYIQGDKLYIEGKFKEAIKALEIAVSLDPKFALAYQDIAMCYAYLGYPEQVKLYALKAMELLDHVSDREKYLIQGSYYNMVESDYEKTIEIYKELLSVYPEDEEGNMILGSIYRNLEEWDLALAQFEKVLRNNVSYELGYHNVSYINMAKGNFDEALEVIEKNKQYITNQSYFHRMKQYILVCKGEYDLAQEELTRAKSIDPEDYKNDKHEGSIYHIKGEFQEAERIYKELLDIDNPVAQLDGYNRMGYLNLSQGRYDRSLDDFHKGLSHAQELKLDYDASTLMLSLSYVNLRIQNYTKALEYADMAVESAHKINFVENEMVALHYRGLTYLKMGNLEGAEQTAKDLREFIDRTTNRKYMRHHYHLAGMIALARGQLLEAEKSFEQALSLLPAHMETFTEHSFFMEPLVFLYFQERKLEKAKAEYEKIISYPYGRVFYGDIYTKSFYMLGKIFEEQGNISKAIENYEKFLNLWNDADPGIVELEDARKRVDELGERN